ncbi:MAG: family 78 glycoside hydrolase catalytic domain [Prevotella sp.]|nr:family 78 glycoside hydrolase catalytic domain [Prevotella sp.]
MSKRSVVLTLLCWLCLGMAAFAQVTITRTTCNYQDGESAMVEGRVRVGWQYELADGGRVGEAPRPVQDRYQVMVVERVTGRKVYDSGMVRSSESQHISLPVLSPNRHGYQWRVRIGWQSTGKRGKVARKTTEWSRWQTLRMAPADLANTARWIGAITKADAHIPDGRWSNEVFKKDTFLTRWKDVDTLSARSIILRKEFGAKRRIADAVVHMSGLGHYELTINGRKVGDSEFAPLWSEYSRTIYYNTYDVTSLLRQGDNAIAVLLGNGFFNVQRGNRYSKLQASFGPPQLLLRLDITYDDGTTARISSDDTWRWMESPITFNSIFGGESYDARLEQDGCLNPGFDDSRWRRAVVVEGAGGVLRAQTAPPVKVMERYPMLSWKPIHPDSLAAASRKTKHDIHPSAFVCDMGQNLAGFPSIKVSGRKGQKVTLFVSERLTPQGACDQSQVGRPHYYEYTLRGDGVETWQPRFSYYGFRYIQVEGAVLEGQSNPHDLPVLHDLQSCFVYNSAAETSSFWCDNDIFTKTHRLIERAERSNMQAVLTDCPHREKLGWLEQDHLCGPSLLYNYDMATLVPKILRDIADTQKADGMVPTTAPQYVSFGNLFDDSPEWGSTLVILPFMYYDIYGDSTLVTDYYEPMRRYVDYLGTRAEGGIVSHGLGDWYDYGPWKAGFSRNTPVPLVATAHYIYDLQLITQAARMTGNGEDEQKYATRLEEVVEAFNRHFYKPDSCYYGSGSQASNALPLFLGITGEHKAEVLENLVKDIHAHGDRLTTGDVGNRYLFRVLADNGCNDLLFRMLNHYETPGYGFQIAQGATTLTEQWDPRQGASENHFMLGQIDEWFFRSVAGIRQIPGTHGMRRLVIDPQAISGIHQVRAVIHTLYGKVTVSYDDGVLQVAAPLGCEVYDKNNNPLP